MAVSEELPARFLVRICTPALLLVDEVPGVPEDTRRLVTITRLDEVDFGRVFSRVTLSARTNVPYLGLQLKYRLPFTDPSFLPETKKLTRHGWDIAPNVRLRVFGYRYTKGTRWKIDRRAEGPLKSKPLKFVL